MVTPESGTPARRARRVRYHRNTPSSKPRRNAVIAIDALGAINYANPQVEATFGYAVGELLGQPVEILLPEHEAVASSREAAERP
jgi:PAS domain S-box-containing protein